MKVSSTAISAITYRKKTRVLYVHMVSGEHIAYEDVPEDVYESFIHAGSIGKYYNANIRSNYSYRYV